MTDRGDVEGWARAVANEMVTDANRREIRCPRDIDDGWCLYFAERVADHLGRPDDVRVLQHTGYGVSHAWIEHRGRHYDAEAPAGVDDWRDLPFVRRNPSMIDTSFGGPMEVPL